VGPPVSENPYRSLWAEKYGLALNRGWKDELAKRVKETILKTSSASLPKEVVAIWHRSTAILDTGLLSAH